MRRAAFCAAAAAGVVLSHSSGGASAWGNVPLGSKIPEVTLSSTTGQKIKISVGKSKALLLLYVRANHERSTSALKAGIDLHTAFKDKGLRVLAVSTVKGETQAITALTKELKLPFPVLVDDKEEFYGRFGVFIHPVTGVVDAKGVLRYEYSSFRPDYLVIVERQVKAVLGLGPPPDQIKDVDRNEMSPEERKKYRKEHMQEMARRMERMRAERRLVASRAVLSEENAELALKLFRAWADLLDLPKHEPLAALASQVAAGKELKQAAVKLKPLAATPTDGDEAKLWLGRALGRQGQAAEAKKVFEACAKATGVEAGQCAFELAGLVVKDERARAVKLCQEGHEKIFGKP